MTPAPASGLETLGPESVFYEFIYWTSASEFPQNRRKWCQRSGLKVLKPSFTSECSSSMETISVCRKKRPKYSRQNPKKRMKSVKMSNVDRLFPHDLNQIKLSLQLQFLLRQKTNDQSKKQENKRGICWCRFSSSWKTQTEAAACWRFYLKTSTELFLTPSLFIYVSSSRSFVIVLDFAKNVMKLEASLCEWKVSDRRFWFCRWFNVESNQSL